MKLDLACGNKLTEGFIGVDIKPLPGVDYIVDLEQYPWPFEDNSVEEIFCGQFVEHVKNLVRFMEEIYRICKHKAKITIMAPYFLSSRAWGDPTHVRGISDSTFFIFNKEYRQNQNLEHYDINTNIRTIQQMAYASEDWRKRSEETLKFATIHYANVVEEIVFVMEVIKEDV